MLVLSVSLADLICARVLEVSAQAFQAFQRLARTSQLSVLPNVAKLICLLVLLTLTGTPSATLWGYFYLLGTIVSAAIGVAMVCRELGIPLISKGTVFKELKQGFYFSVSLSSQNVYNDIDKTMLARFSSLESAGIYGAAYRIVDVSFAPILSLLHASYTRFFKSGLSGIKGTLAFSAKLLPYAMGYGLVVSLMLFITAPLLPILLGKEYGDTVLALRWLSLLPFFRSIHYFAANSLTGAGFQGVRSVCQLLTVLLNVLLILWLIPAYSWKGAAWASLATDFFLAVILWMLALWLKYRQQDSILPTASPFR
jgi:O-antigen/teichoic acid export membrane protein